jgi:adenine-specific DNA-methyltransferase
MRAEGKSWKYTRVLESLGQRDYFTTIEDGSGQPIKVYRHTGVKMTPLTELCKKYDISEHECYLRYFDSVFRDTNAQSSIRTRVMEAVANKGDFFSIDYIPRSGRSKGKQVTLYYKGDKCDLIAWLKDVAVKKGERLVKLEKAGTYWEGFPLNNLTKEGGVQFPQGKKPEALIQKVLELATNEGDWVLDSFGGSGTTGAVAHKMRRRWIMVELGEHCHTHIVPRLKKVIDGADPGGITEDVGWTGGGGFRYYRLAPSLLEKDKWGQWVISKEFNAAMLAEAACKLEGFTYAPSDTVYWQHGHSTERDFIYVTTQHFSAEQLAQLSDEVGPDRTLLVLCAAFRATRGGSGQCPNLTVKNIPKQVLSRCEWGHDDYSLKVENLPKAQPPLPPTDKQGQQSLFGEEASK